VAGSTCAAARTSRRRPDPGVQAAALAGAYWRGPRGPADAPAHLRHRVGVEEGAQGPPEHARGGPQARPPQARSRARADPLPEELGPGLAIFLPKGRSSASRWRTGSATRRSRGYQPVYTPHIAKEDLWRISGHLENYAELMYPGMELDDGGDHGGGRARLPAQADELPVPHPGVHLADPVLPRAAAADLRARHRLPLRALRRGQRDAPRPRVHPGRLAHLLPRRPGRRRGRRLHRVRPRPVPAFGLGEPSRVAVSTRPRQVHRDRRAVGVRRGGADRGRERPATTTSIDEGRAPSTGPRSTSTPATRSGASGS
jgi:hypothetical protein